MISKVFYYCEVCGRSFGSKEECEEHEKICERRKVSFKIYTFQFDEKSTFYLTKEDFPNAVIVGDRVNLNSAKFYNWDNFGKEKLVFDTVFRGLYGYYMFVMYSSDLSTDDIIEMFRQKMVEELKEEWRDVKDRIYAVKRASYIETDGNIDSVISRDCF